MTTCRDVAHRRLVEEHRELPVDVKDAAIFHAGPIIRPLENDQFEWFPSDRRQGEWKGLKKFVETDQGPRDHRKRRNGTEYGMCM